MHAVQAQSRVNLRPALFVERFRRRRFFYYLLNMNLRRMMTTGQHFRFRCASIPHDFITNLWHVHVNNKCMSPSRPHHARGGHNCLAYLYFLNGIYPYPISGITSHARCIDRYNCFHAQTQEAPSCKYISPRCRCFEGGGRLVLLSTSAHFMFSVHGVTSPSRVSLSLRTCHTLLPGENLAR